MQAGQRGPRLRRVAPRAGAQAPARATSSFAFSLAAVERSGIDGAQAASGRRR